MWPSKALTKIRLKMSIRTSKHYSSSLTWHMHTILISWAIMGCHRLHSTSITHILLQTRTLEPKRISSQITPNNTSTEVLRPANNTLLLSMRKLSSAIKASKGVTLLNTIISSLYQQQKQLSQTKIKLAKKIRHSRQITNKLS